MSRQGYRGSGPRVLGIFGSPVRHSLSPAMHNAAFAALGLPWTYVPFEVEPATLRAALEAVRVLGMPGCNLTIPLKEEAPRYMDALSDSARLTGAVNTVENRAGVLRGHNTDGEGYLRSLREEMDFTPRGKRVVVIGAGGAARGIGFALAGGRAASLTIVNRHLTRAAGLAGAIRSAYPSVAVEALPLGGALGRTFVSADLLVHATPVGMTGRGSISVPLEKLRRTAVVSDIVYVPRITGFLRRARALGLRVHPGLGMLLHQGALSLEIWTRRTAPLEIMRKSLVKSLGARV